jgi:hypothetical protein
MENNVGLKKLTPKCGIIMPISAIDNCSAEHWSELLAILRDVITDAEFEPNLVSDADEIGVIQKRIIQNLYSNEIVVCDVSCKNPNVMFELGMRLAFDKPTIIIKDDKTDYTFDTSIIEHLGYPRDLRFNKILAFKDNLKRKLIATNEKKIKDPNYSTFLKNFGEYKIAHLSEEIISSDKYILNSIEELKSEFFRFRNNIYMLPSFLKTKERITNEEFRNNYLHKLIGRLIDEFVEEKDIKTISDLRKNNTQIEELYNYLKSDKAVVKLSTGASQIKEILEYHLEFPF